MSTTWDHPGAVPQCSPRASAALLQLGLRWIGLREYLALKCLGRSRGHTMRCKRLGTLLYLIEDHATLAREALRARARADRAY